MKVVCMIPARLGSKRVKNKVIRMLGDKPLIQFIIDTVKEVFRPKDIYLNSSYELLRKIAHRNGIQFYQRRKSLSKDNVTINDFLYDFLLNTSCDYAIVANPTSPFIEKEDLTMFYETLMQKGYDVLHSVKEVKAEGIYKNRPINFNRFQKQNSQDLEPIYCIVWGLMGFKKAKFIENYQQYPCAVFGTEQDNVGYYILKGFSTIDIDWEDDFRLAESIIKYRQLKPEVRYYDPEDKYLE